MSTPQLKVEKLPDEPIIIATLAGDLSIEIVREMYAQTAQLLADHDGILYRITDIRATEIDFSELVNVLASFTENLPGSPTDPRISGVLVGTHGWSEFFTQSAQQEQYGAVNITVFEELEVALAHLRAQIEAEHAALS